MWHYSLPVTGAPPPLPPSFSLPPPHVTNFSPQFQQHGGALLPLPFPPSSTMYPPHFLPPPLHPPQPDPVDIWKEGISQPQQDASTKLSVS